MYSVALIGPDGAGKTTICRSLVESNWSRFKYLYMGINRQSANVMLPTTRWAGVLRNGRNRKIVEQSGWLSPLRSLKSAAGLANRLAEEWFRQLVSWSYRLRGYVVLYDRHFFFDFLGDDVSKRSVTLSARIHRWCLLHLYPGPDLVIYLDAPAEILHARKGEGSIQSLEARRTAMLAHGRRRTNFVCVDATQPLDAVFAEVARHIDGYRKPRRPGTAF